MIMVSLNGIYDKLFRSNSAPSPESVAMYTESLQSAEPDRRSGRTSPSDPRAHSPVVTRHDLAKTDFQIPNVVHANKPIARQWPAAGDLGDIDISHYVSEDRNADEERENKLGEVKLCLAYNEAEEELKIVLKSIEVYMKPSAVVVGCSWAFDPNAVIRMLPEQKKKKDIEISFGTEQRIFIKREEFEDKTLRVTVYDSRRRHKSTPVGHALFPLRELANKLKMNTYTKKIASYSQAAGFNKGRVRISLTWNVTAQRLEVVLGEVTQLKNPKGVEGKDYFMKITAFVNGEEFKSMKTATVKANPAINFREKVLISLSSAQLKNSSLVFKLYMRHFNKLHMAQELIGKTSIGPYMMHADRRLSQWEQVIITPHEEITEEHTLYL